MNKHIFLLILVFSFSCLHAQKDAQKGNIILADTCAKFFLNYQVKTSGYVFIPTYCGLNEKKILKIRTSELLKYLQTVDSIHLDSSKYLSKILSIYCEKEKFTFDNTLFEKVINKDNGSYTLLNTQNVYTSIIKKKGLQFVLEKYLVYAGKLNTQSETYKLDYNYNLFKLDEYNLSYLEAALFRYYFIMSKGDQIIFFTKYLLCPPTEYQDASKN